MEFTGIGRDKDSGDENRYELRVKKEDVTCLYMDRYGIYICTIGGKMMKVDHTVHYLREELGL